MRALSLKTLSVICAMSFISDLVAKDRLLPGEYIQRGDQLTSSNGCFRLAMQHDGNLVIYKNINNQAIWSSRTDNTATYIAFMQRDGNFVTYTYNGTPTWNSQTQNHEGAWVVMQGDGNLVVYAWNSLRSLWASNTVTNCY
ncbi:hypothetical protein QEJ31_05670 [Pigmentibacter sp. JX0631]|uniref:hypothetical protein n=1 Tax=Pigmentibacter sp. JX0631 TaxID=2976982 RepID=UPI0024690CC7|nr:hypothetical protein [Pigmentibacter sp. JX0631]WGL61082.1 hypothetical protein QEJ31_05670 [Pigmentibacter sp. JX0631]